jgi:hypothetical protein
VDSEIHRTGVFVHFCHDSVIAFLGEHCIHPEAKNHALVSPGRQTGRTTDLNVGLDPAYHRSGFRPKSMPSWTKRQLGRGNLSQSTFGKLLRSVYTGIRSHQRWGLSTVMQESLTENSINS